MSPATARLAPPVTTSRLPLAATIKAALAPGAYFEKRLGLPAGSLVAGPEGYAPQVRCPLHRDRTPSLSIQVHIGAWHCAGCQKRGSSVIDFEMALAKLDFDGARANLARDFGIMAEESPPPARLAPSLADSLPGPRSSAPAVNLIRADRLRLIPVTWLWPGWLAAGKLHVLAGAPGTGKTTLAMDICATLTRGGRWPDGGRARAADVAIWSGEDDPGDTLIPRLLASGADLRGVHFIHGCHDQQGRRSFDPANDADLLADAFASLPFAPGLLVVDPIVSAVSGDSHQSSVVRRSLQPLVDMASIHHCAILGISHFSKGTQGRDPTERVTGSLAFGALARVVLVAAKLPSTEAGGRLLARAKSNLGADGGGYCYDLEALELADHPGIHTTRVLWGKAMEGSARDLLSIAETPDDGEEGSNREIDDFVRDCLANGPLAAADMQREAKEAGYSFDKIHRSSVRIGVEKRKNGFKNGWTWTLPKASRPEDCIEDCEDLTLREMQSSQSSQPSLPSSADGSSQGVTDPCPCEEF